LEKAFEGFGAYRLDEGRGPIKTVVPDLNFFAVRLEWRDGPTQLTEYRHALVRPQPADLFSPPPDAATHHLQERGAPDIELEVRSPGGRRERVLTREGTSAGMTLPDGRWCRLETRLLDELQFVVGVKVYSAVSTTGTEGRRRLVEARLTPAEELVLDSWRPVVTTTVDPPLEIRLTKVGGRTYSMLTPGIY